MTEKDFHKNRIAFAIINEKLVVAETELSHYEWLTIQHNITDKQFESIYRGYIRQIPSDDKTIEIDVVTYQGKEFSSCKISNKHILNQLNMLAVINYLEPTLPSNIKIRYKTELIKGETGEIWQATNTYREYNFSKNVETYLPSIKDIISLDDKVTKLLRIIDDSSIYLKGDVRNVLRELRRTMFDMSQGRVNIIISNMLDMLSNFV